MDKPTNITDFFAQVFEWGEGIGIQQRKPKDNGEGYWHKNEVRLFVPESFKAVKLDWSTFCINPIDPINDNNPDPNNPKHHRDRPRITTENVTGLRGMLIECDNLTPKQQTIRINKSGMPYSAKVFSGNQSYHYQIFFDRALTLEEYEATFDAIVFALKSYGYQADVNCKNPNRLTRAPFRTREGSENEQKLAEFNGRVKWADMLKWLKSKHVEVKPVVKDWSNENYQGPGTADEKLRWEDAKRRTVASKGPYGESSRQPWIYKLGCECKNNGLSKEQALEFTLNEFEHDEQYKLKSGIENAYKYATAQLRTLNGPGDTDQTDTEDDEWQPGFQSLFRVGNDYYQLLPDKTILPLTVTTICTDYGERAHLRIPNAKKFDRFTFIPNILKQERRIIDKQVRYFNRYNSPKWKLIDNVTADDIPYHLHMCKRVFWGEAENQLEVGLDYLYIALFRPEQKIPNLVLGGSTEVGKSEFMKHMLRLTTTRQPTLLTSESLESSFNNEYSEMWFKCIDEVKVKSNQGTENRIKKMMTDETLRIEPKGKDAYFIDNYSRWMMTTNDTFSFINIEQEENRYWIRIMSKIKQEDLEAYPNYTKSLIAESGKFISWLWHRGLKVQTTNENKRFWFRPEQYYTNALSVIKSNTKSSLELAIDEIIERLFIQDSSKDLIYLRAQSIKDTLETSGQFDHIKITHRAIISIIGKNYELEPFKSVRVDDLDGQSPNATFFEIPRSRVFKSEPQLNLSLPDDVSPVTDVVVSTVINEQEAVPEKPKTDFKSFPLQSGKEADLWAIFDPNYEKYFD